MPLLTREGPLQTSVVALPMLFVSQGIQSKILTSKARDTKKGLPLKSSIVSLGTLSRKDKGHKAQQRVCRPPSLKRKKDHGQQDFFNYCCFPFAALFEKKQSDKGVGMHAYLFAGRKFCFC